MLTLLSIWADSKAQFKQFSKVYPVLNNAAQLYDAVELNSKFYSVGWLLNTTDFTDRGYLVGLDNEGNKLYGSIKEDGDSLNSAILFKKIFSLNSNLYVSGKLLFYDSSVSKFVLDPILIK